METNRIVSIYYHNIQGAKASTYTNAVTIFLDSMGSVTMNMINIIPEQSKASTDTNAVTVLSLLLGH
jgi:hypothetical protein